MNLKHKFYQAIKLYFMLVTFISILLMILGLAFDSERTFSYSVFLSPLIYAAVGVLPVFLPGHDKELSVKMLILKKIIELVIIETIIFILAFSSDTIPTEKRTIVAGIALGIFVIYILANVLEYLFEKKESKELYDSLLSYQESARISPFKPTEDNV